MPRIYVTEDDTEHAGYDGYDRPQRRAGYFDPDKATYWHGGKYWDGNNNADLNTKDAHRGQGLYRTAQGRWVLRGWSNWQGEQDTYTYATEDTAREWLLFNEYEDAVREHFGEPEEERGPGRPEVGGTVSLRLGDVLDDLDRYRKERDLSRAEAARRLIREALDVAPRTR